MPAGAIDPTIGDRTKAENKLVLWREGVNPLRILLHKEISPESFSSQLPFIYHIRNCLFFRGTRF